MPIIKILRSFEYISGSTIPFRIVDVTSPPAKKAPRNSKMAAIITACLSVRALEPTDVPMALATSFAPMPHAIKKPRIIAIVKIKNGDRNKVSIYLFLFKYATNYALF